MEEKNQLNDIILNKSGSAGANKKIILAVATLGVVLIVVVMLMSTLSPDTDNLPQPSPLPVQHVKAKPTPKEEPLFEEVAVIKEDAPTNDNLDKIAQRLKKESVQSNKVVAKKTAPKKVVAKKTAPKKVASPKVNKYKAKTTKKAIFVQVGSFAKYSPDKKFLNSISKKGYEYKFHKVTRNSKTLTKVLVGPFSSQKKAKIALKSMKSSVESGAFIVRY